MYLLKVYARPFCACEKSNLPLQKNLRIFQPYKNYRTLKIQESILASSSPRKVYMVKTNFLHGKPNVKRADARHHRKSGSHKTMRPTIQDEGRTVNHTVRSTPEKKHSKECREPTGKTGGREVKHNAIRGRELHQLQNLVEKLALRLCVPLPGRTKRRRRYRFRKRSPKAKKPESAGTRGARHESDMEEQTKRLARILRFGPPVESEHTINQAK